MRATIYFRDENVYQQPVALRWCQLAYTLLVEGTYTAQIYESSSRPTPRIPIPLLTVLLINDLGSRTHLPPQEHQESRNSDIL